MFKKGDKVTHSDYGNGEIWKVNPKEIIEKRDKNNKTVTHKGTVEVAFDSEMGELWGGDGEQKTLTFLSDGRELPIGSGYFFNDEFFEYDTSIVLTKINKLLNK